MFGYKLNILSSFIRSDSFVWLMLLLLLLLCSKKFLSSNSDGSDYKEENGDLVDISSK